jgi:succinate-semialdehyde dehydrogenase/glutarate-semialdehyde dehydrogenase
MALQTKNPATEELVATFDELTPEALESKLALADSAFKSWKKTSFKERADLMKKLGTYLREHTEELAKLQTIEMGKTIKTSRASVEKCADLCDYYADNAEKILSNEILKTEASEQYAAFEPLGVVLAVMPWNFPYWQVYRFAIPAIMAGNVGVLKHASNVRRQSKPHSKLPDSQKAYSKISHLARLALKPSFVTHALWQ